MLDQAQINVFIVLCLDTVYYSGKSLYFIQFSPGSLLLVGLCSVLYSFNPLSPHDASKHHFTSLKNRPNFLTTKGLRMKISLKLVCQYMAIFSNFSLTSSHLHSLELRQQFAACCGRDDNGKIRPERVNVKFKNTV